MKYTVMIDLNNSWHKVAYYLVKSLATARLQKVVGQGFRAIVVPDAGYNLLERSNSWHTAPFPQKAQQSANITVSWKQQYETSK